MASFTCAVCQIECSGPEQMRQHLDGKLHAKKSKFHLNNSKVSNVGNLISVNEHIHLNDLDTFETKCATSKIINCNTMESQSLSNSISSNQNTSPYYCTICEIACTGREPFEQHKSGKHHRNKVILFEISCKNGCFSNTIDQSYLACDQTVHEMYTSKEDLNNIKFRQTSNLNNQECLSYAYSIGVSDNNSKYACNDCGIECTGEDQYKQHIIGKKHCKKKATASIKFIDNGKLFKSPNDCFKFINNNVNCFSNSSFNSISLLCDEKQNMSKFSDQCNIKSEKDQYLTHMTGEQNGIKNDAFSKKIKIGSLKDVLSSSMVFTNENSMCNSEVGCKDNLDFLCPVCENKFSSFSVWQKHVITCEEYNSVSPKIGLKSLNIKQKNDKDEVNPTKKFNYDLNALSNLQYIKKNSQQIKIMQHHIKVENIMDIDNNCSLEFKNSISGSDVSKNRNFLLLSLKEN